MKRTILTFITAIALCTAWNAAAAQVKWYTNFAEAQKEAQRTSRNILLVFTGSSWCGYSQRLDSLVFSTAEFQQYAAQNLVLLSVDFPRNAQLESLGADVQALLKKYPVNGFPTYYLLDVYGKVLFKGSGCAKETTAQSFIQMLEVQQKKRYTNLEEAQAEAKRTSRNILLIFTGSDWCGYCKILERKVLSTPEFQEYAAKHFVLLIADFPRKAQPKTQKADAQALIKQYPVEGFPTYYVLAPNGKILLQESGCSPDITPQAFLQNLEKKLKK